MEAEVARLVITDSPYKLRINYNVSGLGATRHRDFAMASADDPIGTEDRIKFVIGSGLP
jgi:hypothetical protein